MEGRKEYVMESRRKRNIKVRTGEEECAGNFLGAFSGNDGPLGRKTETRMEMMKSGKRWCLCESNYQWSFVASEKPTAL